MPCRRDGTPLPPENKDADRQVRHRYVQHTHTFKCAGVCDVFANGLPFKIRSFTGILLKIQVNAHRMDTLAVWIWDS